MGNPQNQEFFLIDHIIACLAGDRRKQELLYKIYAPKMFAVCMRYTKNARDAEDLLQEGFIKVYNNLAKFRNEGSFEGWVRKIFINTALDHYRRGLSLYSCSNNNRVYGAMYEEAPVSVDISAIDISQLVQQLPPGYRAIFSLFVIEGYSHKEISDMLDISEGTSKSQLSRAKVMLRKKYAAAGR